MLFTNEQLYERIQSDKAEMVVSFLFKNSLISSQSHVHRLAPDTRSITEESYSHTRERESLIIKPFPEENNLGISGIDLRFGRLVAWTDTVRQNATKDDLLGFPHKVLEPGEEFVMEHDPEGNKVYYVTSFESVSIPSSLEILIDSKSTTGRVGGMSHEVGYDNKTGEIIKLIQLYSFPLKVTCGKTSLSQAVIRYKGSKYLETEKILSGDFVAFEEDGQSIKENITPRGLSMNFSTDLIYRARKCDIPVDMDARGTIDPKDYWERIEGNSKVTLDAKTLYLFGSLGKIKLGAVCGLLSREEQVLTGTGTWGHFAGIFQPFWKGGVTMEVYGFSKREICRGDRAGIVIFDEIEVEGGRTYEGSYQNQRPPMLPKMFSELR